VAVVTPFVPVAPAYDAVAAGGIGGLSLLMAGIVLGLWRRYLPASAGVATAGLIAWMALTGALAASGALARVDVVPPPMALLIVAVLALSLAVGLSRVGGALARAVPLAALVGVQAFRLPLELVMHRAAEAGIMPPELSYSGYNFDIVTGAGALLLGGAMAAGVAVPRAAIWAWNLWGFWCLAAIVVIAVTTSPMVRLFGDDPRHVNTWVLYFPYVWLPAVLVVIALAGHVVVTRALLADRRSA
jgi:hypothetical protein